ncbi:MAG: hypothetical protein AMXMBFR13_48620 [Phycisphaerae bacterium]
MSLPLVRTLALGTAMVLSLPAGLQAAELSWSFQRVDAEPSPDATQLALGLGGGAQWPKVFYDKTPAGVGLKYLAAASLKPTGWSSTILSAAAIASPTSGFVGAASSSGGAGAVWRTGNSFQVAQFTASGWQVSTPGSTTSIAPVHRPSIDYGPDGRAVIAYSNGTRLMVAGHDGSRWQNDAVDLLGAAENGYYPSIAVGSDGARHLVYRSASQNRTYYAVHDLATGKWSKTELSGVPPVTAGNYSLAVNPNNVPSFACLRSSTLEFASFDTAAGAWDVTSLATGVDSTRVNLAFDGNGRAGLAFVSEGLVRLMLNDGGGWTTHTLPSGPAPLGTPKNNSEVALAFDADNLPVLAYYSNAGVILAYDPIVPEPATLVILASVLSLAGRRRRR